MKRALRQGGGFHEMFPVSMASKARELGFSARELLNGVIRINGNESLFFANVKDSAGNIISGGHHGSSAGRHFHNQLSNELNNATTKGEAQSIIDRFHNNHARFGCPKRG